MNTLPGTPRGIAAQQAALDDAAVKCAEIVASAGDLLTHCPDSLQAYAVDTMQTACDALDAVVKAGGMHPQEASPRRFSLSDLATLDTDDGRELLRLLTEAQAVAERIDLARGRCLPEGIPLEVGESRGTDLAESISMIAVRVKGEIQPPKGRD
jgi:hypothetical protein